MKFLQCSRFKLQQTFSVKLSVHLHLNGLHNSYLIFELINADPEGLYPPKLAEVLLRHYISHFLCESFHSNI